MHVSGSCHCGEIRFEAEIDPNRIGLCHCTDCQTFGGSAFRIGTLVGSDDFRLVQGEPAVYEKKSESGSPRHLMFCANCGTHLWGTTPGRDPRIYSLRVATLEQREALRPELRLWCRSAPAWLDEMNELHRIEKQ